MNVDRVTLLRPNGLHLLARATLSQLSKDPALATFADGLLLTALDQVSLSLDPGWSLAQALHHSGPQTNALLASLLVLDAEISAVVDDEQRVFPLPGFLTYRARFPLDQFPLNLLRLPLLNPDGHYLLTVTSDGFCFAVRLDLHPQLQVAGHVRIALGSPTRLPPERLQAAEHRLDRQVLREDLIEAAIAAGSEDLSVPLTEVERARLVEALRGLSAVQ